MDKAALEAALLAMRVCPRCQRALRPARLYQDVWGCHEAGHPPETWYIPREDVMP